MHMTFSSSSEAINVYFMNGNAQQNLVSKYNYSTSYVKAYLSPFAIGLNTIKYVFE